MQVLSCTSAIVLVAICGLLLRSQVLVSGARSPNFEATDPDIESSGVSSELMPIIVLLCILLTVPTITAIILAIRSNLKFKKLAKETKHKALELETQKCTSRTFLGKEHDSYSNEHLCRSQSNVPPQEVVIRLSIDTSSSEDIGTIRSRTPAADTTSSAPLARPPSRASMPSPNSGSRIGSTSQGERSDFDTDFHFSDSKTFQSLVFAADATSSAHNRPLNTISSTSSMTGNQNKCSMHGEYLSSEAEFHFCDFQTVGIETDFRFCDFEAAGNANASKNLGSGS
jgi:hypothetical protein